MANDFWNQTLGLPTAVPLNTAGFIPNQEYIQPLETLQLESPSAGFAMAPTALRTLGNGISTLTASGTSVPGGFGAVNTFGFNNLGTGLPGLEGSLTGTGLTTIGTSAALGGLGGGFIAGLTGGNPLGGSIGGSIGSALGSGIAGTSAGTAIGSAIGIGSTALSLVLPGIGTILGGIVGGMFGGKPHPISEFVTMAQEDGKYLEAGFGAKHYDKKPAEAVWSVTQNYLNTLQDAYGLNFQDLRVRGGVYMGDGFLNVTKSGATNVDPYKVTTDDVLQFNFDPEKPEELSKALTGIGVHLATMTGAPKEVIDAIQGLDVNAIRQSNQFTGGPGTNWRPIPTVLGGGFRGGFSGPSTKTFAQAKADSVSAGRTQGIMV